MSAIKHMTRLYLSLSPEALDPIAPTVERLEKLTSSLDIACINIPLGDHWDDQNTPKTQAQKNLIADMQQKNIAVLADMSSAEYIIDRKSFEKALERAYTMNCDGIHLWADAALYERARVILGANAIIGADCGTSKHFAMQLGEMGADYIAFSEADIQPNETSEPDEIADLGTPQNRLELVRWWQELFEVPCLASDVKNQAQCEDLLGAHADFIAIGPTLWPSLLKDEALVTWLATRCPFPTKVP